MIFFVLHEHHRYAVWNFMEAWARDLRPRVKILTHQDLRYATKFARGTYVFGDLDRLTPHQLALSANIGDQLAAAGCRVLNAPARVAWRHELCRRLEADGLNAYRCFRATDDWSTANFPVFVRREDDHGSLSRELLHDAAAVRRQIEASGDASQLLVIEYLDTRGADGVFRKYSALRIGDALFPRHLLFSKEWVVKYADLVDESLVAEEERFLNDFDQDACHAKQVRRAFELASVDYGRIDYSLTADGRVQVWEINLSPNLSSPPNNIAPQRLLTQQTINAKITAAIAALDTNDDGKPLIEIQLDKRLLARVGVGGGAKLVRGLGKLAHRTERCPVIREMLAAYRRARWIATQ